MSCCAFNDQGCAGSSGTADEQVARQQETSQRQQVAQTGQPGITNYTEAKLVKHLYELRDHAGGLNCGRWDYIFNFIKCFRSHADFVLPAREQVTMTTHFLRSYSQLLIKTCHRRGIHAMGGMAAQIPIKNNPQANEAALAKVLADKEREASDGHDGTWVAHPGLVPVALQAFDKHMPQPNQISRLREDVRVTAADEIAKG